MLWEKNLTLVSPRGESEWGGFCWAWGWALTPLPTVLASSPQSHSSKDGGGLEAAAQTPGGKWTVSTKPQSQHVTRGEYLLHE